MTDNDQMNKFFDNKELKINNIIALKDNIDKTLFYSQFSTNIIEEIDQSIIQKLKPSISIDYLIEYLIKAKNKLYNINDDNNDKIEIIDDKIRNLKIKKKESEDEIKEKLADLSGEDISQAQWAKIKRILGGE